MSFQGYAAKYRRLFQDSAAWRLLRADNAPFILAFVADLFADGPNEVLYSNARVALETELTRCREQGIWETETPASQYLNQWVRAGWLREMDDQLTRTDACEVALRFVQGLDDRSTGTSASHLRIVQEAVRDLAIAISANPDERLALLEQRKTEVQQRIDNIHAGIIEELPENEQRERLREIYQLASVLTGDFRRVEDEIRELDQSIRVQMIEQGGNRGEVLLAMMEKESLLARTDAGGAFEGFFQLLCDENRTLELREQLRTILTQPVAEQLPQPHRRFLARLMRELTSESDRVFQIRRRTEESLRSYIESGSVFEQRAVDQLLLRLERIAVTFAEQALPLKTEIDLVLPVGHVQINSPDSYRLKQPDEKIEEIEIVEQINRSDPSLEMLQYLDAIRVQEVAAQMQTTLREHGPMTIAGLTALQPIQAGLEELVACIRVAKLVGATALAEKESIEIVDKQGVQLLASIPQYWLAAELFPTDLEQLAL